MIIWNNHTHMNILTLRTRLITPCINTLNKSKSNKVKHHQLRISQLHPCSYISSNNNKHKKSTNTKSKTNYSIMVIIMIMVVMATPILP